MSAKVAVSRRQLARLLTGIIRSEGYGPGSSDCPVCQRWGGEDLSLGLRGDDGPPDLWCERCQADPWTLWTLVRAKVEGAGRAWPEGLGWVSRPGGVPGDAGSRAGEGVHVIDSSPNGRLSIAGWREFVAVDEPTADALLGTPRENVLPADGLMMLYGDGGTAKTTLTVDLAHHLAGGVEWLGLAVERRRRVLLIENEGSRGAFRIDGRDRLASWTGPSLDGWLYALDEPWGGFSFTDRGLADQLIGWGREVELDAIVAGPLVELGAAGTGAPGEVTEFMRVLAAVREALGRPVAFVLPHHENVAGRLSGAWARAPQTLVHVTERGPGKTGLYWRKARHASGLHGQRWKLDWAPGRTFARDETPEVTDADLREGVLGFVREHPGTAWNPVMGAFTGAVERKREVRDALIEEGALVNLGGGKGGAGGGGMRLYLAADAPHQEAMDGDPSHAPSHGGSPGGARIEERGTRDAPYKGSVPPRPSPPAAPPLPEGSS